MNVLFVCTGNTCRSPMAEALCRRHRTDWQLRSRGLAAFPGQAASPHAQTVMKEHGLSLESHRASPLAPEDMCWAERIYVMGERARLLLCAAYPEARKKIQALGEIDDPYGLDVDAYREAARALAEAIEAL